MGVQPQRFAKLGFRVAMLPQVNQDGPECIVRRDHAGFVFQCKAEFAGRGRELLGLKFCHPELVVRPSGARVQLDRCFKRGQRTVRVTVCFEPSTSFSKHFSGGIVVKSFAEGRRRLAPLRQLRRGRSADNSENGRKAQCDFHDGFALSIADPLNLSGTSVASEVNSLVVDARYPQSNPNLRITQTKQ
jgi:hypothetical protein